MSRPRMARKGQPGARKCNSSAAAIISTIMFLATWNVQGLSCTDNHHKIELIVDQFKNSNLDICAIQETKTKNAEEIPVKGQRLILFDSKCRHYGLGFIVSPRIVNYIVSYESLSDRVACLDVKFPSNNGSSVMLRFVNAYGPTS